MNKKLLSSIIAIAIAAPAMAEINLYGKANVAFQAVDGSDESHTELISNASRLGFKGSETINDSLEAIYQLEYEIYIDDGRDFAQRNIFVGLKGNFGQVIAGHYDTPLKVAQNKIDLFNDLPGDIKNMITVNDNRESNQINYTTPSSMGPITVSVSFITHGEQETDTNLDDGVSASIAFEQNGLYLAAAMDQDVEEINTDTSRIVAQYTVGSLQLGGLFETFDNGTESVDGFSLSAQYKINDWALKVQAGESDIDELGGEMLSLGADYKLSSNAKTFVYVTSIESDLGTDADFIGLGFELKF